MSEGEVIEGESNDRDDLYPFGADDVSEGKVIEDEWITRKVQIVEPIAGEILVRINLSEAVRRSAFYALGNASGISGGEVTTSAKSQMGEETRQVRNVWLRLNGLDRKCFLQNERYADDPRKVPKFVIHKLEEGQ